MYLIAREIMWCCRFKNDEWIVCSLRATQKGSVKAAMVCLNLDNWRGAKNRGIRCEKVKISKAT